MTTATPAEIEAVTLAAAIAERDAAEARLEAALDALQALTRGLSVKEKNITVRYDKVIDDRAALSGDQLRSLHFARGVLVENGR